jgi:hypothetical protein
MTACHDCKFYEVIDETQGSCKHNCAERLVIHTDDHNTKTVNGWPTVSFSCEGCGEFVEIV